MRGRFYSAITEIITQQGGQGEGSSHRANDHLRNPETKEAHMKRTLVLLLAASLFLVSPALASAARGDGHGGGQKIVTREKVVIYQTSQQRDHRYDRSDRHRYEHSDRHGDRQIRNYYRPPRHAPAYGYYKNHYSHRHQPKKVVRRHARYPDNSIIIGVPSVIIRLGF
jgi:hypothetical protein